MKIVALSDTHLDHPDMSSYWGDMIIHCGDVSCRGYLNEIESFLKWYSSLSQFKYKIMIPGNHDRYFESQWEECKKLCDTAGIICLNDSGIEIEGIKIWGSPITPEFCNWAFNRKRGEEIQKHWNLIPNNVNILITHGPPMNIGDLAIIKESKWRTTLRGERKVEYLKDVGCENLRKKVDEIKPKYHLFGHIHEGYGIFKGKYTTFINCAHLNRNQIADNPPVEFYYE